MSKIVLFDGFCNLCSRSVKFIIRHDRHGVILFAALSSDVGQRLLKEHEIDSEKIDSIVYLRDDIALIKSTAVLYILRDIGGWYKLLFAFIVIPRFLRDLTYNLIAKSRYRVFGRKQYCLIPGESIKARFLE